jgi:hypothetical protein
MHIVENKNEKAGRTYCYACECLWDKTLGKYNKPRVSIGHLEGSHRPLFPIDPSHRYLRQIRL